MNLLSKLKELVSRLRHGLTSKKFAGKLREFIYLDEVSVYSLLAARKGKITTEYAEGTSRSSNKGLGWGESNGGVNASIQSGHFSDSQVLSKATVQTSFKELYDSERAAIVTTLSESDLVPKIKSIEDIEVGKRKYRRWVVDFANIRRGDILEVEVELEAESVFAVASAMRVLGKMLEDSESFRDTTTDNSSHLPAEMVRVLDGLLVGLVPIQGRLVDYEAARIKDQEVLIHRSLLEQVESESCLETNAVYLVGVTQDDLYWKDIRRVLFSKSKFTVFCRLATEGLGDTWNPIKAVEVLTGWNQEFDRAVKEFRDTVKRFLSASSEPDVPEPDQQESQEESVAMARKYLELLASHHDRTLQPESADDFLEEVGAESGWTENVEGRRQVFAKLKDRLDESLGVETSSEVAYKIRQQITSSFLLKDLSSDKSKSLDKSGGTSDDASMKHIDTEIVAIYW